MSTNITSESECDLEINEDDSDVSTINASTIVLPGTRTVSY